LNAYLFEIKSGSKFKDIDPTFKAPTKIIEKNP